MERFADASNSFFETQKSQHRLQQIVWKQHISRPLQSVPVAFPPWTMMERQSMKQPVLLDSRYAKIKDGTIMWDVTTGTPWKGHVWCFFPRREKSIVEGKNTIRFAEKINQLGQPLVLYIPPGFYTPVSLTTTLQHLLRSETLSTITVTTDGTTLSIKTNGSGSDGFTRLEFHPDLAHVLGLPETVFLTINQSFTSGEFQWWTDDNLLVHMEWSRQSDVNLMVGNQSFVNAIVVNTAAKVAPFNLDIPPFITSTIRVRITDIWGHTMQYEQPFVILFQSTIQPEQTELVEPRGSVQLDQALGLGANLKVHKYASSHDQSDPTTSRESLATNYTP
jgi:hypothetical protein